MTAVPAGAAAAAANGSTPPPLASSALATPATGSQLVGNPNRTMVAIADTDPQGRPVATGVTAAAVAALSAPVGYGKLVVISSNFAGKEYELSRPQMIVGRTDENDIVVNHRSISRNHAKLVREPDTGRYTISDLQSSNGVRVNGQDYGKVELRRADVVDLGHVRLRFVEPGEDFVFSRDAVITDVPDSGGKKGLLVAIVLGVVVLGAVGAFFLFKNNSDDSKVVKPGSDHTDLGSQTNGTDVAVVTPGSNGSAGNAMIADTTPDAALAPTVPTDDAGKQLYTRCLDLASKKKWGELLTCSNDLTSHDPKNGPLLHDKAEMEIKAEIAAGKMKDVRTLHDAAMILAKVPDGSVYYAETKAAAEKLERQLTDRARALMVAAAEQHNCKGFARAADDARVAGVTVPTDLHCEAAVAEHPVDHVPDHVKQPDHHEPNTGSAVVTPPQPTCVAADLKAKAESDYTQGNFAQAMVSFKKAWECGGRADPQSLARAYQSACKAQRSDDARNLFHALPMVQQSNAQLIQICLQSNIDPRK
jgi:pSer/pThr/pTyr-binding forkhead associated (FHA) protein